MRTPLTLSLFGVGLVVVFLAAFGLGRAVGPGAAGDTPPDPAPTASVTEQPTGAHR